MKISVGQVAGMIGGTVVGDASKEITGVARIEDADADSLSFVSNIKYASYIDGNDIGVILVGTDFDTSAYAGHTFIVVDDVSSSIQQLLLLHSNMVSDDRVIQETARIHESSTIGDQASIGDFVVVGKHSKIGDSASIASHCYIGSDVIIGDNIVIHSGVRILDGTIIGDNCVIHSNAVIGSDGFGFKPNEEGHYTKIPHIGNVKIGNEVEIGAGVCIDRAVMGSTIIEEGVKLDNLIHVAHNVRIEKHTVIAAQAGIAGSTSIGAHCMIGGQVGIVGHIKIEEGTQIQAQSGVMSNHRGEKKLFGYPAIGYSDYLKSYALFKNLPKLYKELNELRKNIKNQ